MDQLKTENHEIITVVSGLPRSGTSMMMQMLRAGGLTCLTDELREADISNPKGYFEFEKVKGLRADNSWLPEAKGKVIKIISHLLSCLPPELNYKIIFMERDLGEVLASQRKMLANQGRGEENLSDERLGRIFAQQLRQVRKMLADRQISTLFLGYKDVLEDPVEISTQLQAFLGNNLDQQAMRDVVDRNLYRQRLKPSKMSD
ncbi:MAG: sulfotransferase domain-containing protein [Candidatus Poribacteria bacterium]|nr:sulfotransferase domain-containing protein [Candidatus Poribacteria bacterium]